METKKLTFKDLTKILFCLTNKLGEQEAESIYIKLLHNLKEIPEISKETNKAGELTAN